MALAMMMRRKNLSPYELCVGVAVCVWVGEGNACVDAKVVNIDNKFVARVCVIGMRRVAERGAVVK